MRVPASIVLPDEVAAPAAVAPAIPLTVAMHRRVDAPAATTDILRRVCTICPST